MRLVHSSEVEKEKPVYETYSNNRRFFSFLEQDITGEDRL